MYFCPCCGYRVLYEQPTGTYLVCPICFWEDTGDTWGLRQAQLNFVSLGAVAPQWLEQVRCPTDQDERDPSWQLLDEKIKAAGTQAIQQVISAFKDIKLNHGISLYEAREIYLISDYAYNFSFHSREAHSLLAQARATTVETDWQDISPKSLAKFLHSGGIFYLDPRGWQYYLPASMVWSLRQFINLDYSDGLVDFDEVIWGFLLQKQYYVLDSTQGDLRTRPRAEYLALITDEQLTTICQFLYFLLNYATDYTRETAQEAMAQYWNPLCQARGIKNEVCASSLTLNQT